MAVAGMVHMLEGLEDPVQYVIWDSMAEAHHASTEHIHHYGEVWRNAPRHVGYVATHKRSGSLSSELTLDQVWWL